MTVAATIKLTSNEETVLGAILAQEKGAGVPVTERELAKHFLFFDGPAPRDVDDAVSTLLGKAAIEASGAGWRTTELGRAAYMKDRVSS